LVTLVRRDVTGVGIAAESGSREFKMTVTEEQKNEIVAGIQKINPNADEAWIAANSEQVSAGISSILSGTADLISGIFEDIFN
jgi:hypothetical protein